MRTSKFSSQFWSSTVSPSPKALSSSTLIAPHTETFEGLGIGSRLAYMDLPKRYSWVPVAGAILYGLTTPIGIAAGLGVRSTYNPGSTTASIVSGVLDAFSAGILIYTGLVEVSLLVTPVLSRRTDRSNSSLRTSSCSIRR